MSPDKQPHTTEYENIEKITDIQTQCLDTGFTHITNAPLEDHLYLMDPLDNIPHPSLIFEIEYVTKQGNPKTVLKETRHLSLNEEGITIYSIEDGHQHRRKREIKRPYSFKEFKSIRLANDPRNDEFRYKQMQRRRNDVVILPSSKFEKQEELIALITNGIQLTRPNEEGEPTQYYFSLYHFKELHIPDKRNESPNIFQRLDEHGNLLPAITIRIGRVRPSGTRLDIHEYEVNKIFFSEDYIYLYNQISKSKLERTRLTISKIDQIQIL